MASVLSAGLSLSCVNVVVAQTVTEHFVVDFEGFEELTPITNQYEHLGVTFALDGVVGAPIIAKAGSPCVAFVGLQDDGPMAFGTAALTDPPLNGDPAAGQDIRITFDPPVTSFRLFIADIDAPEVVNVRAYSQATEVASVTRNGGEAGTGNGVCCEVAVSPGPITSVLVDVPERAGYAIDFLAFTRECEGCGKLIEVAQESAPGAADFDEHVLANIVAFPAQATTPEFYGYHAHMYSWSGHAVVPGTGRSYLMLADTSDGMSLFVVHDTYLEGQAGWAEMRFQLLDDSDGAIRLVEDDPQVDEQVGYQGEACDSTFTSVHGWSPCCTDGLALGDLSGPWTLLASFSELDGNPETPPFRGLSEWSLSSADGAEIALALEPDRRVRLRPLDPCLADVTRDDVIDMSDLLEVIDSWGTCACPCPADCNGDGVVSVVDLTDVVLNWGTCLDE